MPVKIALFTDQLQKLNSKIIISFIFFAVLPLFIFSVLGYYLNKRVITDINMAQLRALNKSSITSFDLYFDIKNHWLKNALDDYETSEKTISLGSYLNSRSRRDSVFSRLEVKPVIDSGVGEQSDSADMANELFAAVIRDYDEISVIGYVSRAEISGLLDHKVKDIQNIAYFLNYKKIVDARADVTYSDADGRTLSSLLKNPAEAITRINLAGQDYIICHTQVTGQPVIVFTAVDPELFYTELDSFRNKIILANLIFALIVIVLAVIFSQRITTPIHRLIEAVQHIRHGDLNKKIIIRTRDEIEILANEFELMRQKLQESYLGMEEKIRKRTRELQEAQAQISHQEKMASLGMMAAGIAHEIGNPLTSISSMVQVIKRKTTDLQITEYVANILKNIERISRIVREMVDFSRPSSYEEAPADVNEIIKSAVGIIRYDRRSKNLEYELDLDPDLSETVLVSDHLLQVFLNILINAIDASEGYGKKIRVRSFTKKGTVHVHISDQGSGIPAAIQQKIFEPFYTTKEVGKGTGLGLTVSYGFIKNLNGEIKVRSTIGKGSVFMISIPVRSKIEEQDEG